MTCSERFVVVCSVLRDRVFHLFVRVPIVLIACVCATSGCATTQHANGGSPVQTIAASELKLPPTKSTLARRERVIPLKVEG